MTPDSQVVLQEPAAGRTDYRRAAEPEVPALPRSQRLARLRKDLLDAPYSLCTQKAELLTAYLRAHTRQHPIVRALAPLHYRMVRRSLMASFGRGERQKPWQVAVSNWLQRLYVRLEAGKEPPVVAYARALAYVLERVPLRIYPHELIVGNPSSQRIGAPIHPDLGGMMMLPELDTLRRRPVNPLRIAPEQIQTLEEDIFPFWFNRSVIARAPLLCADPELQNTLMAGRLFVLTQFAGIAHVTPDYPAVVEKGFTGLLAEVETARAGAATPEQAAFYEAAAISARAAIAFGERCSRHCAAAAAEERNPQRRAELERLAAVLAHVPAHPARSFHEAVQSTFLAHVIVHQESFQHGVSFGRVDQYLYPYYRRDLDAGRLTPAEAVEILGCFLGKAAELLPLFNTMATEYFSGLSSASGLTLGGTDAHGNDAANELSILFLEAYDQMRLRQPNLHVRVHPRSSPAFMRRAYEVVKRGGGMPAFFNDDAVVPALEELGVARPDARDYAIVGCVEWGVPYRGFPAAGAGFLSLPAMLDRALHGGIDGEVRRPVPDFESMDALIAALRREMELVVAAAVAGNDAIERTHALHRPTPLLSLLVRGCVASGVEVNAGGATYNSTGFQGVGVADVADSLAAIEQLVFVERRLTFAELMAAVDADFEGQTELRDRILNKVPKYGEDAGRAEHYARLVADMYAQTVRRYRNPRGGPYAPGFWTMTTHIGFGRRLGALPSGRRAGQPIGDGVSPANGADRRGPTASMLGAAHAGGPHVANGCCLNERLDPNFVKGAAGTAIIDGLTRGYFAAGGMQVQYNVLDAATLIDAKRHPERYRDLVVRISGYSAYFNDLTEAMKDELIGRTLHSAGGPACMDPGR
ncbi:hypothetical protein L6Q96_11145 [Candidatus Binatia bacterium]|nr:hypothetical protein [Candidatus Binatia bacterium]